MNWTDKQIQAVWNRGDIVNKEAKGTWRKDACGAWIKREDHGSEGDYGWEIDHIYPKSKAEDKNISSDLYDALVNLRPLHHKNNGSGGKGDDYPSYTAQVTSDGSKNINKEKELDIHDETQKKLEKHFGEKLK